MKIPIKGIQVITNFNPDKVFSDWISFGSNPIWVNTIPSKSAANAIAPFCAKVIKPYKDDSVLTPVFHSPYSIVSGSIDQNNTPVAPLPMPINPSTSKSSTRDAMG